MEEARKIMNDMIATGMSLTDPRLVKQSQIVDELHNEEMRGEKSEVW